MAEIVAMATFDDDMNEDSVYSSLLDTLNSSVGEDALSLEDLAWADSCLNKDLDPSDSGWSSLKDALLEILSSPPEQGDSGPAEINSQLMTDKDLHSSAFQNSDLHSSENVPSLAFGRGSDENEDLIEDDFADSDSIENSDDEEDDLILVNRRDRAGRRNRSKSVFRPNYTEEIVKVEDDSGMDLSLTTVEVESSADDIFKVWDLGISDEKDDFTKQFEALGDFSQPIQPTQDESHAWKDVMHVSVDDLIAGIGDLSLKQNGK